MAVRLLARDVSELCLGKPPLTSLSVSATAAEALAALKNSGERFISVWSCDHAEKSGGCACVGRICMVDLICFLCREDNLSDPSGALRAPVSDVIATGNRILRHLHSNSSVLDALDCVLEGAQNLVIPIESNKSINSRKKHLNKPPLSVDSTLHNGLEYCWLTPEDVVRFLLDFIAVFSPVPVLTLESLNIIDTDVSTIYFDDPVSSALGSITRNLTEQKPIAIINEENKLVGDISPYNIADCDEALAAAMATLSAGDLMAFIDYGGPDDLVHLVQMKLEEKNLGAVVELMGDLPLSLISSSTSCSSDEEFGLSRSCGSSRASPLRSSNAIVCHPWSSLVAVMVQASAHRINYVWVVKEDYSISGIVTLMGILKVFRGSVGENLFKQ